MATDLLKLTGRAVLVVLVVGLAGAGVTRYWRPDLGLAWLVGAGLICLGATLISLLPMLALQQRPERLVHAWLAGAGIRIGLTFAAALVVWRLWDRPVLIWAFWVVVFYLALLLGETCAAVRRWGKTSLPGGVRPTDPALK